ncbi:arylesterase [Minwuia sp.]|uniref:arylesterase n=1 Tax=Minwuia sp. TaxID=2493630 RepID=UPI003A92030D
MAQPIMADDTKRVVMLGDSITAGYGLNAGEELPVQLEKALEDRGITATVENAGVSGDTTAGGLSRLDWAVQGQPDLVIVALGANDGLRGIDPADTRANLAGIVAQLQDRDVPVMLAGMYAPPNMGSEYAQQFNAIYPELAGAEGVPLYPFLLDGVAAEAELNQADGIHPNPDGVKIIAERMAGPVADVLNSP